MAGCGFIPVWCIRAGSGERPQAQQFECATPASRIMVVGATLNLADCRFTVWISWLPTSVLIKSD